MANVNSISDFLRSRGFTFSDKNAEFDYRKNLYSQAGLAPSRSNEFRGAPEENLALLNLFNERERRYGTSLSPQNISNFIRAPQYYPSNTAFGSAAEAVSSLTPPAAPEIPTQPGATPDVSSLFNTPDANEISRLALEEVTGGAKFPLQQEANDAEKAGIALEGQAKKEKLISDLASRGLFFSGKRTAGLEAIDADTLAREFGVDRKFALLIAGGLESASQRIAKEAQQGNKDALASLRSLGFDVNPLTGAIEPTLSARRAEASEARLLAGQEATQRRFEESQAAAENRFKMTYDRLVKNAQESSGAGFTKTQINSGAAKANLTIDNFKKLDADTQNYYISNSNAIDAAKKKIDTIKSTGKDPDTNKEVDGIDVYYELVDAMASGNVPVKVREDILKYWKKAFPNAQYRER